MHGRQRLHQSLGPASVLLNTRGEVDIDQLQVMPPPLGLFPIYMPATQSSIIMCRNQCAAHLMWPEGQMML